MQIGGIHYSWKNFLWNIINIIIVLMLIPLFSIGGTEIWLSEIIIIIIIKKGRHCKAGRERLTPYQSEDPSPTAPT